jgi:short-subunit dehydrogenase
MTKPGIVWITGAGKGIGRALAWEYAARGWTVAASARTEADLAALVQQAEAAGLAGRIAAFPANVTHHDAMKQTFKAIETGLGQVDHVIFNAGTSLPTDTANFSVAPFRTLMEINFLGVVNGIAAVLPTFMSRRAGRIGVMGSVAGYNGLPLSSAYGASKAALINMCESLKPELDVSGVALSIINPGFVRTPLTSKNRFAMPFLMEADEAARVIYRGMMTRKFEIAFPFPLVAIFKGLRMAPYALFFAVTRRIIGVKKRLKSQPD